MLFQKNTSSETRTIYLPCPCEYMLHIVWGQRKHNESKTKVDNILRDWLRGATEPAWRRWVTWSWSLNKQLATYFQEEVKRKGRTAFWLASKSSVLLQNVKMGRETVREKTRSPGFVIVSSAGKCEDVFATELSDPVRYSKHKKCSTVSFTKERIETLMSITNRLSESKHSMDKEPEKRRQEGSLRVPEQSQ